MTMIHPGYNLLAEGWADMADEPLRIVQRTAQGLGLPLRSLEIELGPSQVEAVFDADRCARPPPTRWCCSATACARRCAAPATTRASSAGRRSRT